MLLVDAPNWQEAQAACEIDEKEAGEAGFRSTIAVWTCAAWALMILHVRL